MTCVRPVSRSSLLEGDDEVTHPPRGRRGPVATLRRDRRRPDPTTVGASPHLEPALTAPADPVPVPSSDPDGWQHVASHDGTAIAWRVDGSPDAPTVVLCNGIACDDGYWTDVWPRLADEVRVVRWHYRGHGRSAPPANPEEVIVSSVVRDLRCVLEASATDQAVLVGHSYGVQVVCETYRAAPESVAGLVAVAGAYGHPLGTVLGRNTGALVFPLLEVARWPAPRLTAELLRVGLRSPLAYWVGRAIRGIGPDAPREVMNDYFEHVADLDVDVMLRMFRAMQEHTSADVLPDIDVPTTVIAGGRDGMTPPRLSRRMAELVPGARLVELPGATHVLPVEEPDTVVAEVLAVVAATS